MPHLISFEPYKNALKAGDATEANR